MIVYEQPCEDGRTRVLEVTTYYSDGRYGGGELKLYYRGPRGGKSVLFRGSPEEFDARANLYREAARLGRRGIEIDKVTARENGVLRDG